MKFLLPLALAAAALSSSSPGAVISNCRVLLTTQGSYSGQTLTAEELVERANTIWWGVDTEFYGGAGERRLGGGDMTIALDDGEMLISATIDLWEGHRDNPIWRDSDFTSNRWVDPFATFSIVAPLYYEVTTNFGTFSKQYYFVPESSSACLAAAGLFAIGFRRRR
jgi:hypothetical protein